MQISFDDIQVNGWAVAGRIADKAKFDGALTIEKYKSLKFPEILQTKYAKSILTAIIMGSIEEYHNQLREKLLENGIDIGEMDYKSQNLRSAILSENETYDEP